ncbi:hypothetical protein DRH29_00495 [candidate division Kazan bacterium]|uniref:Uncharacterized protein n=1 Tax=candidate division Kazan bacterium TaxID=2202143 RepID=A0A420ZDP3_UNCK3|nr:MAG: hypothetical protein DRH29_00495 [candidate division Kazan bacterium]
MKAKMEKGAQIGMWIVAILVAGLLIFLFVQKYQGTNASLEIPRTETEMEMDTSLSGEGPCRTSGRMHPRCLGGDNCPKGTSCKVDLGDANAPCACR